MAFLHSKQGKALLILLPNAIVAFLRYGADPIFATGAALGAATFVYVFYYLIRFLLQGKDAIQKYVDLLSIVGGYAAYYLLMYFS